MERRKAKQGYGLGMETKLVWEQLRRWVGFSGWGFVTIVPGLLVVLPSLAGTT